MKKLAAMIVAAAMVLSMAACTDSAEGTAGTDISTVSQKVPDPDSSRMDKLTPPTTIAQDFAKQSFDYYRYYSSASDYDKDMRTQYYYKGEIAAEEFRQEIFDTLCRIISSGEMTLKDGQKAGQSEPELTIEGSGGEHYVVYKCIITNNDEEAGGPSAYAFISQYGTMYFTADSEDQRIFDTDIREGVISDENLVKTDDNRSILKDKVKNITDGKYSDFTYIGGQQTVTDKENYVQKVYEGEIVDNVWKQKIFTELCDILKNGNTELKGEQHVQGGARNILTLKTKDGEEIGIGEGILVEHPQLEGGAKVYVLKLKNGTLYYGASSERFDEFVRCGVTQSEKNLVKTIELPRPEIKKSNVKPQFPLSYIKLRTNYAWGEDISGTCFDAKGAVYYFHFSKSIPTGSGTTIERVIKNLNDGIANITASGAVLDTAMLEQGVEFASKMNPEAKFTCEHKMCDYGQDTLYALVDSKPVKLYSKGDNDEFTDDVNAQKAIECFERACDKPVKAVAIPD